LDFETYYVGKIQPMTDELKAESRTKLEYLALKDKERVMLEEAKNRVESYIYQIKNKLIDDEDNIAKISTEEQREELRKLYEDGEEWLSDEGYNADLATMEAKYAELSEPAEKVWFRLKEMTARPAAVKEMQKKLNKVEELLMKWKDSMPQITDDEKADVTEKVDDVRKWLVEKEEEQAKKESYEDPAFTSDEVPLQTKSLERLISKLMKKPKPKPEKKKEEKASNETKAEESGNQTDTVEEDTKEEAAGNQTDTVEEDTKEETDAGSPEEATTEEEDGDEL
jgi:hypoxia up-regulated 1